MLTLFDYFRSSASFRVRIALNLKQLNYETIPIHLINHDGEQYSEKYREINPQSLVPTLKDNDITITQSLSIIEYLEEKYPHPSLYPSDLVHKAWARSFALTIAADIHPLNNLRVLNYLKNELQISETQKNKWYQHWIEKGLIALEKQLTNWNVMGDFCFGHEASIADICLIPQLYNAKRFNCDLSAYPNLLRIDAHCQTHSAFVNARPLEPVT